MVVGEEVLADLVKQHNQLEVVMVEMERHHLFLEHQ